MAKANFERNIAYIKEKEKGLSRAKTDTSSRNPAPCLITDPKTGITADDYHTNRGIIWPTFKSMAPKLGYEASCKNFELMPDKIWVPIYKQ